MSAEPPAGNTLVQALRAKLARDCGEVVVHETHISWVLLAGTHAFKIKKPVRLGFLDFSTLESRRHCCEEELRINRRLASALYLAVVPITGTPDAPCLGGERTPIEYAVQMRRFADGDLASARLARGALSAAEMGSFAAHLSAFHEFLPPAAKESGFGTPVRLNRDLDLLFSDWPAAVDAPALDALRQWFARCKEQRDRWVAQRAAA
ncbi:MAG: aminoglycoside phosphotransferase, partial [Proteobacteria bacterium]|nr:aminoglycoside phosphotransferase [Pseudomonadota bacterium]